MRRQYRFLKGYLAGTAVAALMAAGVAAWVTISVPPELTYQAQETQRFRSGPIVTAGTHVPLAPYVEGWKDGVPFPRRLDDLPDNTVPEPGTLWLIGLVAVVWVAAGFISTWIMGPKENEDDQSERL